MTQADVHYFDALHRVLLDRIQRGSMHSALTIVAVPQVHGNPLFWQTCTYPAGLAAAVLTASLHHTEDAVATSHSGAVPQNDMTCVPATPSLSLVVPDEDVAAMNAESGSGWPHALNITQLIGGTPLTPSPSPAPTATTTHKMTAVASSTTVESTPLSSTSSTAAAPTMTTTTTTATAANMFTLPELYQILRFCAEAPRPAAHPVQGAPSSSVATATVDEADSGLVLLRQLVRLLEQPMTESVSRRHADGDEAHGDASETTTERTLSDGETVDLLAVCATLVEQVRDLSYVNPLAAPHEDECAPPTERPPQPAATTTTKQRRGRDAVAEPTDDVKRRRTASSGAVASEAVAPVVPDQASHMTTTSSSSASPTTGAGAPVMGLLGTQRQLLDAATSPYASTDAVDVLLGIAPLPGSTRVLPSFAETDDALARTDEGTEHVVTDARAVKVEQHGDGGGGRVLQGLRATSARLRLTPDAASSPDDSTQDDEDEGKDGGVKPLSSDGDEDKTVLEVLLTTLDPVVAVEAPAPVPTQTRSSSNHSVAHQGALPPQPTAPAATSTPALVSPWHAVAHPSHAGTPAQQAMVREQEEAARVAFAIAAFNQHEAEVAAEVARQRREAIMRPNQSLEEAGSARALPVVTVSALPDAVPEPTGPRRRVTFTEMEDAAIIKGVARFGQTSRSFQHILRTYQQVWQPGRTAVKLYDHWRDALKKKALLMRKTP